MILVFCQCFLIRKKWEVFAKDTLFCYDTSMPQETDTSTTEKNIPPLELTIKDEEQFHDRIVAEKKKHAERSGSSSYQELADRLHTLLKNQDSESSLTLITRGALALGSSDIHYDTGESTISVRLRIDGDLVTITELTR